MKTNFFSRIQMKILLLILTSLALSVGVTFTLFIIFFFLKKLDLIPNRVLYALYSLDVKYGYTTFIIIMMFLLFLLFVLIFSRRWGRDFHYLMHGVEEISKGEFQFHVPVYAKDELGEMAGNINRLSERLQESIDEERRAVQAKNELITNVSHDLRTPLTSIIGYLRLIEEDRYKDEVELRYYVTTAFEKATRLERMVSDLFEYTRVNFGAFHLNKAEIDLIQLLSQMTAQFIPLLEEVNMEIEMKVTNDKIMMIADGDKLVRVFENLMANAIKYGIKGKKIELRVTKEEDHVVIEVVNFGETIPSTDLPYIFERFYRVEKSRSVDTGGSGLGLAIAKSIVELHEGTIEVFSNEMETRFKIILPLPKIA